MVFNPWRPCPFWLPKKDGWYRCTVESFENPAERKVIDLYFDASEKVWMDKRRQQVFDGYKVYKSGREALEYNRVYTDRLCVRNDVVAWRKMEKPCRRFKRKGES